MTQPKLPIGTKISIALLALYTFSIGVEDLITIPLAGNKVQVPEILFLIYAFSIFLNVKNMRFKDLRFNKLDIAVVLYFSAVALSFFVNRTHNAFGELLGITYLMGLFFLTKLLIVSSYDVYPKIREIVFKAAILGAITAILFGLLGYVLFYVNGSINYIWYYKGYPLIGDSIRIKGSVSNPITLCDYLVSLVILLIPTEFFDKKTKIGLIAFVVIGVIATKTKALILLFSSVLVYFTRNETEKPIIRVGAQAIAALAVGFYLVVSHFMVAPADSDSLSHSRAFSSNSVIYKNDKFLITPTTYAVLKQSACLAFISSPIVGIGGNELIKFNKTLFDQKIITVDPDCAPHSTYFGALGELGLLGFCAVLFLLYAIYQQMQLSPYKAIYLCLFGFIIFEMVTVDLMTFRTYWLMLAFLATENYQSNKNIISF
jgi:hypothetical protein